MTVSLATTDSAWELTDLGDFEDDFTAFDAESISDGVWTTLKDAFGESVGRIDIDPMFTQLERDIKCNSSQ